MLHQVESHPKIDSLLVAVPSNSLSILLRLRRGRYQLAVKQLRCVTDPLIVVPAPSAPLSSKQKDPDLEIVDPARRRILLPQFTPSIVSEYRVRQHAYLLAAPGVVRLDSFRSVHTRRVSSPPTTASTALVAWQIADNFQRPTASPTTASDVQRQITAKQCGHSGNYFIRSDNQSNSDSESDSECIFQPYELVFMTSWRWTLRRGHPAHRKLLLHA